MGNALYDGVIVVQEVPITQFRCIGVDRVDLGTYLYKNRFDAQAAKSLSVFYFLVELLEAVKADLPYHTFFQSLYTDHGRLLWQKTRIITYEIPFFIEIIGPILAVLCQIVSNQAGFYKDEMTADLSRNEEMLPFFILFSMKELPSHCLVGRGKRDIIPDSLNK